MQTEFPPCRRAGRARRLRTAHRRPVSSGVRTVALWLGLWLTLSCGGGGTDTTAPELTINIATPSVRVGESIQLSAVNARGTVAWTSSNTAVATVVSTGFVTAVGPGTSTITATTPSQSTSVVITVAALPTIAPGTSAVSFTARAGGVNPDAQSVSITNSGEGTLQGLAIDDVRYGDGQPGNWLQATLSSSTASTAQPALLQLAASVQDLTPGVYTATIVLSATGAASTRELPVTFTVTEPPAIVLSSDEAVFTAAAGSADPVARTIEVTAATSDQVSGLATSITYGEPAHTGWLSATLGATGTPAVLTLRATTGTRPVGTYTATVAVTSPGASNSPRTIAVTFTVTAAPRIALGAATLAFTAPSGGAAPAAQTVEITNTGGGTLQDLTVQTLHDGTPAGWLSASLNRTTAPATLTVQPSTTELPTGVHTARLRVSAPGADNSPQEIVVTITVGSAPSIAVSATSAAFSAGAGGANPAPATIQVTSGTGATLSGLTASVQYTSGSGWLSATLNSTTAPAVLTLQATTGALAAGTYTATVQLAAPSASNSPRTIDVTFTVSSDPVILVAPASLSFASTTDGPPPPQTIAVTNGGGGSVSGLSLTVQYAGTAGWLTTSLNTTTAPATVTVQPSHAGLVAGTYTATLRIASASASNSPVSVTITYTVTAPPSITLSATSRTFTAVVGGANPPAQTVQITNGGSGTVSGLATSISYGSGSGWLAASLDATTAPATLTLTATRGALTAGTYTATVNVTSPTASNSPRPITVTFTVQAGPTIALSGTTASFSRASGTGNAPAATISVTNSGGGTLSGLSASIINYAGPAPNTGWLTATLNTATAPATLTITANTGTAGAPRNPGTYTATVRITSAVAGNSPRDISVTFTVLVSLANNIYPELSTYCSACHFAGGSLPNLSTVANFRNNMVNVATTVRGGFPLATTYPTRIVPNSSATSYLTYQLQKSAGAYGMPTSATVVPVALRTLITNWINQGANNN